jgi:hypothetical protein
MKKLTFTITVLSILIVSTILITMQSCNKIEKIDEQVKNEQYFIDEKMAINVSKNILFTKPLEGGDEIQKLSEDDYNILKSVKDITPLVGDDGKTYSWVINYKEGGFVVLSADKRMQPVLAYSEDNYFYLNENDENNPNLRMFLKHYEEYKIRIILDYLKNSKVSDYQNYLSDVWDYLFENHSMVEIAGKLHLCHNSKTYVKRNKLLQTKWGQSNGYNNLIDSIDCNDGRRRRPPVGCTVTALAQILKYHADNGWNGHITVDGTTIDHLDWENFPLINPSDAGLQWVMWLLGRMTGMNYGCAGSGVHIDKARITLNEYLGFSSARHVNSYNFLTVAQQLRQNLPVLLDGCDNRSDTACHAWVAEGLIQLYNCEFQQYEPYALEGGTPNNYSGPSHSENIYKVYMNWGWDGNGDGWYLYDDGWEASNYIYFGRYMVIDIKPD